MTAAGRAVALEMDAADHLAPFRGRFLIPPGTIYMDGNSLGLLSRDGEAALARVTAEWKAKGIQGWLEGERPWLSYAEGLGAEVAPLVGAAADEVVATGSTTVNLHALARAFYEPGGERTKLLADDLTFPSDVYAVRSQVALRGLDPARHLVLAPTREGRFLDEEGIVASMTGDVALAVLPSVLYRSGQLLDMARLTGEARRRGIPIGFDCSHSVGVVPHRFDEWGVDFAFWCGYKYLGGGPGCPAFLYLNQRHFAREPALPGWFGYRKDRQFEMRTEFEHQHGAGGWQISSPSILGAAPLEGSLRIIREAGIGAIRAKSLEMTSYLMALADETLCEAPHDFQIGTPREAERRGGHVALEHARSPAIFEALTARGVIADLRPPNVIRVAPSPLYNTYEEIWQVVRHISEI
ncbi:MAG: kynureninase, partial [Candidatus Krumholzibacteriia bacterium]